VRNILTIITKELKIYLVSPIAYVVTILYLMINSFFFSFTTVNYLESDLRGIFVQQNQFFLLFIIPAITMRLFSEEKRVGTIELLLTQPITEWELVLGKFLSALTLFAMMLAFTLFYPIVITVFGEPELSVIFSGYVGLLLLAGFFIAIGTFASTLTQNQILSFVIAFIIIMTMFVAIGPLADLPFFATVPYAKPVFNYLNATPHFNAFVKGVVDTSHIFYFVSFYFLFLFLAKQKIESRRWNA